MLSPSILLADERLVAEGLKSLLQRDFPRIAIATSFDRMLETARSLRPDVILIDVRLIPYPNAIPKIKMAVNSCETVLMACSSDAELLTPAMRVGARSFLLKSQAHAELRQALCMVAHGSTYVSPQLATLWTVSQNRIPSRRQGLLTARQREVLQLVAAGKTTKEVAVALGISIKTAEFHRSCMMDSLGIRTIAGLTRYAIESGLCSIAA